LELSEYSKIDRSSSEIYISGVIPKALENLISIITRDKYKYYIFRNIRLADELLLIGIGIDLISRPVKQFCGGKPPAKSGEDTAKLVQSHSPQRIVSKVRN
jgi:hypothetical protein